MPCDLTCLIPIPYRSVKGGTNNKPAMTKISENCAVFLKSKEGKTQINNSSK